jgi:hypothetical protein
MKNCLIYFLVYHLGAVVYDKTVLKAICVKFHIEYFDIYLNSKLCSSFHILKSTLFFFSLLIFVLMLFGDDQVHVGIPLLLIFLISCCLLCFFRMFSRFYLLWSNILLSQWGFLFLYTPCAVTTSSVVCGESVCIYLYIDASSAPKLLNSLCCF